MKNSESLDSFFTRLIAEHDGVNEKEVTSDYIEERRKEIYLHIVFTPRYPGLISYSRYVMEGIARIIDETLEDIHYDRDYR